MVDQQKVKFVRLIFRVDQFHRPSISLEDANLTIFSRAEIFFRLKLFFTLEMFKERKDLLESYQELLLLLD